MLRCVCTLIVFNDDATFCDLLEEVRRAPVISIVALLRRIRAVLALAQRWTVPRPKLGFRSTAVTNDPKSVSIPAPQPAKAISAFLHALHACHVANCRVLWGPEIRRVPDVPSAHDY
jgi:hypothetical protein